MMDKRNFCLHFILIVLSQLSHARHDNLKLEILGGILKGLIRFDTIFQLSIPETAHTFFHFLANIHECNYEKVLCRFSLMILEKKQDDYINYSQSEFS